MDGEGESGAEEEGNENPRRNMIDEEIFLIHRDTAPWLPLLSPPPSLDPDSAPDPPPPPKWRHYVMPRDLREQPPLLQS